MWWLEQLLKMVGRYYDQGETRAGVVISYLASGKWYVSVARYEDRWKKRVVIKAYADSLEGAVIAAFVQWCALTKQKVPVKPAQETKTDRFELIEIK